MPGKSYLIHHRYSDGSGSGVVPIVIDQRDKALIEIVLEAVGAMQEVDFIEVQQRPSGVPWP
jgi:hypothetical protein